MKIKTKLQMSIVFTLIMIIVVPLTFRASQLKTVELEGRRRLDRTMIKGMSELKSVTLDYLLHADERARTQWHARFESIKRLVVERKSINPKNMGLLDKVREDLDVISGIFLQLEASHDRLITPERGHAAKDMENMLVSQLMIRTDAIINNTFSIQENISAEALADQQRTNLMAIFFLVLLALLMAINTLLLRRNIARPLLRLREGTEIIAGGDLTCRVGTNSNDEIGDLSRAFDEMTDNLQRSYGNLTNEIAERMRAEEALRRAKELAELATQVKSQFLANMSHELRTPMTGVLGMLDLVLAGNLEAEQQEFIEIAQNSARSLVRIINDILDLTKIEMGKISIEAKPLSIRQCVENTHNILLPVAKTKELDLNFNVDDDVPGTLVGDQTRINQVLTNLAGNAVKFTEKGRVELRVAAGGSAPGGKREVTFTVTDTGIGIPDDKKDLLFRVFSQVDESHSRTYGGTGLGLAISKELVERMGGTITFTSEEGKGSTFIFTIPLGEAESERDSVFASEKTATAGDAPRAEELVKPRLLVAEDDQTIRQVLGSMLRMAKYEIDFAENGWLVVEMWESGEYDIILMDVQMPIMNGFEATTAIREKERTCGGHIPIIAMTAHASKEDEERCLAAGMDAFISKPIDFMACLQLIGETFKNTSEIQGVERRQLS